MPYSGRATNRIQWFEGMLLMPHHFQQADQRIDSLFHLHMNTSTTHYWGVLNLMMDESALTAGKISFLELDLIFPDGTCFSMPPEDRPKFTVDLKPLIPENEGERVTIYAALPEYVHGMPNIQNDLPRWISCESGNVCDENTGMQSAPVPVLRPNVFMVAGEKPSNRHVSFPVFQVMWSNNTFLPCNDYVPPMLKIGVTGPLAEICREICKKIRNKIAFLSGRLQSQSDDFLSADSENAIKGLVTGLLPFEAALQTGQLHPFQLYLLLCNLAGSVSILQPSQVPPVFDVYDHDNSCKSYKQVTDYIEHVIERIQEGYNIIRFAAQDRLFRLALRESWKSDYLILGARAPRGMSLAALGDWIRNAVIATDSHVASIREKRILGAARSIVQNNEEMKLIPSRDAVLFRIECNPDFILFTENLNIFNVADSTNMRPLELVLYVPGSN